jgi:hypothetical protein
MGGLAPIFEFQGESSENGRQVAGRLWPITSCSE